MIPFLLVEEVTNIEFHRCDLVVLSRRHFLSPPSAPSGQFHEQKHEGTVVGENIRG
jgi:hypothetical protein